MKFDDPYVEFAGFHLSWLILIVLYGSISGFLFRFKGSVSNKFGSVMKLKEVAFCA